jgi:peptidoglycan hydrolase-like protein with peptidoglycan-binding domain
VEKGYLKVNALTGDGILPVEGARITVKDKAGNVLYDGVTDANGQGAIIELDAPDRYLTLDPAYLQPAYSNYDVTVSHAGYAVKNVFDAEVVAGETAVLNAELNPLPAGTQSQIEDIYITPVGASLPTERQLQQGTDIPPGAGRMRVLPSVIVPEYITVHLGTPTNASASNVRVRFTDYIKNVVSSEIYSTWPVNAIIANIHAIVTFALNRIYTEWYRSRGYNFDITNSTAYDQYFVYGRDIFQNISALVDQYFDEYAHRAGYRNPFFTQYCNGTTATCRGLSQWGTVGLANQGYSPLNILRYYYTDDITLDSAPVSNQTESYPGTALRVGGSGASVAAVQSYLNRIRRNYPLIPAIANPNGYFGADTAAAVRVFQSVFNLSSDGVVGRATWNKISQIYTGITKLAELDSEGQAELPSGNPPSAVLRTGSRGALVEDLQYLLSFIGNYYPAVPQAARDGIFGAGTAESVRAFQRQFGLSADGIVGPATWAKLYSVYRGITGNAPGTPVPPSGTPAYPGVPLRNGSRGENVRLVQSYLNALRSVYPAIPALTADGIFGNATETAVRAFQRAAGLSPDGIIGPATWNALVSA